MSKKMTGNNDAIKKEVRKILAEVAEIPEKKIKDDADFYEDIGIDSMQGLEIFASIEKKYKIRIPEEKMPVTRSVVKVSELVAALIKKK